MERDDGTLRLLSEIDSYVEELFAPQDEALEAALQESRRAGLPDAQRSTSAFHQATMSVGLPLTLLSQSRAGTSAALFSSRLKCIANRPRTP